MKRFYSVSLAMALVAAIVLGLAATALAGPLSVLNTINVTSGSPWGSTVNTTTNKAYMSGYGGKVWVVDGITDALGTTITVGGNGTATGIAANPNTNKIYVGQFITPSVAVIDGNTDTVSTTIPISSGQPTGVAVNPVTNRVYVANQDVRTVTVIDGATDTVLTTVTDVGTCPWGIAVNTTTNEIYVTDNGGIGTPQVNVIDGNTNTVTHGIDLGERVGFVAVNPVTNKAYATLFMSGQVAVIDGATHAWTTTINGFSSAYGIAVDSSRNQVLVSGYGNSTAKLVDGATNTIMDSIGVGGGPYGMACNPSTNKAYVPNSSTQNLSVLQYVAPPVTVSSSSNPAGGGTTSGDGIYNVGDTVNMVASANPGYHFVNWTEGGTVVSTNANYSFAAATSRVLVANFGYQVTVISDDGGGTVSGGGTFVAGSSVTVHGHPLHGTHLFGWWDPDQGTVSYDQDYTFNVTTDRTLHASFGYNISASANPASGGTAIGPDAEYGELAFVNVILNPGYVFLNWTEGGTVVSTSASYDFMPTADRTLVANLASKPTVTTAGISGIGMTGATGGGNVSSDGGASVTARGVCWSTSHNPTTSDSHSTDGAGTGSFTSDISGCTPGTPYYVRAYATNVAGTSYGGEQSFTTAVYGVSVAPTSDAKAGDPGAQVTYSLTVTNTGNTRDTFVSEISGNAWSTGASPESVTLDPGASSGVTVTVDIPAGAVGGASDSAFVKFTSEGDPTMSSTSVVTTTANNVYAVAVSPHNQSIWGSPTYSVQYGLDVANNGNVTDTFNAHVSGNVWDTSVDKPSVTLSSGEHTQVLVTVDIPAGAVGGDIDNATVAYTSVHDESKSDACAIATHVNYAPSITSILPNSGTNNGTVHITDLRGDHFGVVGTTSGYGVPSVPPQVKLQKAGQADIIATNVVVTYVFEAPPDKGSLNLGTAVSEGNKVTCDFDLAGAKPGLWTVRVTNPDGQSGTLTKGGFTVTPSTPEVSGVSPSAGQPGSTLTVTGSNFGLTQGSSTITIGDVEAHVVSWSDNKIVVTVPAGATSGAVVVTTSQGGSNRNKDFTVVYPTWYLAEGTTAWGFSTYITVENPNPIDVTARIQYMDPSPVAGTGRVFPARDVRLPAQSQTTIDPRWDLGDADFCTKVTCLQGLTIAVDRTMFWTGPGAASPEGHASTGVTAPSQTWYLPDGSSAWGFETWTLVENPSSTDAHITLTYMPEGRAPTAVSKTVPAFSRASYNMAEETGQTMDASVKVASDSPVVAEQSMYRDNRREGSCSVGATEPSNNSYMAEGTTAHGFTTYLLIQNPGSDPAQVTVFYLTPNGPVQEPPFAMAANSRKTIRVNDVAGVTDTDTSLQVFSPQKIVAERSMCWGAGTELGEAFHASVGIPLPHRVFYLPDGQTSNGHETYTLVQNPNETDVDIMVTYLPQGGGTPISFTDNLPANTRRTYSMADKIKSGRASVLVQVTGPSGTVVVERSMYWNDRGAGTDEVGGFSD